MPLFNMGGTFIDHGAIYVILSTLAVRGEIKVTGCTGVDWKEIYGVPQEKV